MWRFYFSESLPEKFICISDMFILLKCGPYFRNNMTGMGKVEIGEDVGRVEEGQEGRAFSA